MRVICCQLDTVWENKPANFARARALLERAGPTDGALVLLPEMFASGFTMNIAAAADGPAAESEKCLKDLARDFRATVLGGIVRRASDGRGLNEAVAFSPDGQLRARYCKLHPFSFSGEHQHYAPGDQLALFDCGGFSVAPLICYDLRFPETFRAAVLPSLHAVPPLKAVALPPLKRGGPRGGACGTPPPSHRGATLLCVIANWPRARHSHWTTLLRARAIENQCCVAAVNRCGSDPKLDYAGGSTIIDAKGEVQAEAGANEGAIHAELDPAAVQRWRAEFPALNDMRSDGM